MKKISLKWQKPVPFQVNGLIQTMFSSVVSKITALTSKAGDLDLSKQVLSWQENCPWLVLSDGKW